MIKEVEALYFAINGYTGEIFEGKTFRSVYSAVLRHMKSDLRNCLYFNLQEVDICYGTVIHSVYKHGKSESYHLPERIVCTVRGYVMDREMRISVNGKGVQFR